MKDFINFINDNSLGEYKENVSFKALTTYKTGGIAKLVFFPRDVNSLIEALKYIKSHNILFKIFGNGSNILASDKSYDGVIIKLTNLNKLKINKEKIEVEAGYNLALLANDLTKKGYSGLDFACGIPATIGGAVYMNAGAYLSDISEVIDKVLVLDDNFEIKLLEKKDLEYNYRKSIFMNKDWIILKAYFILKKDNKDKMIELINDRKKRRMESQPLEYPSAGSVFRNPEGMYAGKLIEDCNLKGYTYGGGQISSKHANFIINKNNASSDDIKYLMDLVQEEIFKKYNIRLHREQELFNFGD